jgi:G protein beta subunit-like protein
MRSTLATSSADATIKIWNLDEPEAHCRRTLQGHQRWVWDLAFSADSAYLVSGASPPVTRLCFAWRTDMSHSVVGSHRSALGARNGDHGPAIQVRLLASPSLV